MTESMDGSGGHFYPRGILSTDRMEQDAQPRPAGPASPPRERQGHPPETEPHNLRELQLAAQLGQDLASTGLLIPGTTGSGSEIPVAPGPDSALRAILPHPTPDTAEAALPPPQQVSEPEQDVADQVHHYVPESPHQDQMSLAMPMHLEQHQHHPAPHFPGETPPRKRSKVSRACDECRRKKVKCDAQGDIGDAAICSSCRRSNIPCLFSRVPQKRGPSKGYIKELADRIGSIEQLVQGPGEDRGTKRSFSAMSAGSVTSTPMSSRPVIWGSEPRPLQPTAAQLPDHYQTPYSPNDLAPQPESPRLDSTPTRRIAAPIEAAPPSDLEPEARCEVNPGIFDRYLVAIHPHLPFLHNHRETLELQLGQCPQPLQDAFIETLSATVSSFPQSPNQPTSSAIDRAYMSLVAWEILSTPVSAAQRRAADLTYIQTLLLMAIEADNRPPNTGGPLKEAILGRAVSGALARRLHHFRPRLPAASTSMPEASELVPLRMWWVLVVLDRWHAVSTGCHVLIPKRDMVAPPGLRNLLGDRFYYLLRFTRILGPASTICSNLQDPPAAPTPNEQELPNILHTWLEEDREELPPHITPADFPLVHLAYWHSRLLNSLLDTETTATTLLSTCKGSVALLVSSPELTTPFNHHLTILTTLSLLELTAVDPRKDEAVSLLSDLRTYPIAPSAWNAVVKTTIDEKLALLSAAEGEGPSAEKTARASLQRLADVATARGGREEGNLEAPARPYGDLGFNPAPILRLGYLSLMREMHP
ncbi:uncharacterized protein DNG_02063 [Cephalotrichum gorgonifer]|uniref:Zn(2)-C6 fungal-type domain-containing protein n=1 Tax=Cephalotrichum gorgonifer TaxID=2041049 RepID=A0AAE8MUH4_9PEZI|nr:uncharacterized protein DNG_02063 [Cephalotrichum gorgonifer]